MVSLFAFLEDFNLFTQVFPVSKVKKSPAPSSASSPPRLKLGPLSADVGDVDDVGDADEASSSSNKKVSFALLTSTQRCPSFFKQPNFLRPEFISSIRTKAAKYEYWPEGQVRWTTFGDILEQIKKFFCLPNIRSVCFTLASDDQLKT